MNRSKRTQGGPSAWGGREEGKTISQGQSGTIRQTSLSCVVCATLTGVSSILKNRKLNYLCNKFNHENNILSICNS